jgi:hypothetical protein
MTLDLKADSGRDIFRRLVATADVVVENYRPDVKDRLGIDYASLRAINPRIVLASISGFGQDGPYRAAPGLRPGGAGHVRADERDRRTRPRADARGRRGGRRQRRAVRGAGHHDRAARARSLG